MVDIGCGNLNFIDKFIFVLWMFRWLLNVSISVIDWHWLGYHHVCWSCYFTWTIIEVGFYPFWFIPTKTSSNRSDKYFHYFFYLKMSSSRTIKQSFEYLINIQTMSGSGRFLMWLAKRTPKVRNYLGLEIRQKVRKQFSFSRFLFWMPLMITHFPFSKFWFLILLWHIQL